MAFVSPCYPLLTLGGPLQTLVATHGPCWHFMALSSPSLLLNALVALDGISSACSLWHLECHKKDHPPYGINFGMMTVP